MEMEVKTEYIIYDIMGFISSVGGNLGLFLGFSCFDAVCGFLNTIEERLKRNV